MATVDEIYNQFGGPVFDSILTPLEPQTSRDHEIGLEHKSVRGRLRASLYRMDLRNEIHFNALTFLNMNLSPTQRQGIELEGSWKPGSLWDLFGRYTHARALSRGVYDVDVSSKNLPLVPRDQAKLGVGGRGQTRLSGALSYVQTVRPQRSGRLSGANGGLRYRRRQARHIAGPGPHPCRNSDGKCSLRYQRHTRFVQRLPMAGRSFLLTTAYRWQ